MVQQSMAVATRPPAAAIAIGATSTNAIAVATTTSATACGKRFDGNAMRAARRRSASRFPPLRFVARASTSATAAVVLAARRSHGGAMALPLPLLRSLSWPRPHRCELEVRCACFGAGVHIPFNVAKWERRGCLCTRATRRVPCLAAVDGVGGSGSSCDGGESGRGIDRGASGNAGEGVIRSSDAANANANASHSQRSASLGSSSSSSSSSPAYSSAPLDVTTAALPPAADADDDAAATSIFLPQPVVASEAHAVGSTTAARGSRSTGTSTSTSKSDGSASSGIGRALWALVAMSRPHNLVPSMALVLAGAWLAGGGRDAHVLLRPRVWAVAALSGTIALTSMIANDVFDYHMGVDGVNAPHKPLVAGAIHPNDAELAAGCLYSVVVLGCCCLEPLVLRLLVGGAAVATYVYTPFLKRLTLVKNVVVAAIIASSILAGGLAVGGGREALQRTLLAVLFLFQALVFREMVMDVGDVAGDVRAGVVTVPARIGSRAALVLACAVLAAAHAMVVIFGPPSTAATCLLTACLLPIYWMTLSLLPRLRNRAAHITKRGMRGRNPLSTPHQDELHHFNKQQQKQQQQQQQQQMAWAGSSLGKCTDACGTTAGAPQSAPSAPSTAAAAAAAAAARSGASAASGLAITSNSSNGNENGIGLSPADRERLSRLIDTSMLAFAAVLLLLCTPFGSAPPPLLPL